MRPPKAGAVRLGHGVIPAYFSQHEVELDERGSVLECTQGATGLPRPQAQQLLGRFLFSGWGEHDKPVEAALRRRAAAAGARARRRFGRQLPGARRADEPSRPGEPRGARGRARGVPGHGAARLARPGRARRGRATGRSRSRAGRCAPTDGGWADYVAGREAAARRRRRASRSSRARRSRRPPRSRARSRSSASRRRSPPRRQRSPSSSDGSPRTGATWTPSPPTGAHATSSRRCSRAGKSCSNARKPSLKRLRPIRTGPQRPIRGLTPIDAAEGPLSRGIASARGQTREQNWVNLSTTCPARTCSQAQKASNAAWSVGTALTSTSCPSATRQSRIWSRSSVRPSGRRPVAR